MRPTRLALVSAIALIVGFWGPPPTQAATCTEFTASVVTTDSGGNSGRWETGGVVHVRDQVIVSLTLASDPRVAGTATSTYDARLVPVRDWLLAGSWIDRNDSGYWDGTMWGSVAPDGYVDLRVVAQGRGGYEGLRIEIDTFGIGLPRPAVGSICGA